jgi:hypothetical protein
MRTTLIIAAASVAALLTVSGQARAQANRTFVSGHGSDANPCSLSAPCRSFAQALTQTNPGGEITVLDSAGYGTMAINKAVSITAPDGIEGGITTSSAVDAITVSAGGNDIVNLRGLTLVGGGIGNNGINFTGGATLNVQNCVIRGFANDGITANAGALNVSDTIVSGNAGVGVHIFAGGGVVQHVQAIGNHSGVVVVTSATVAIDGTVSAENAAQGFDAFGGGTVTLVNSKAIGNGNGLNSGNAGTRLELYGTTISGNAVGYFINTAGTMFTFGNNIIDDATNIGTLTRIFLQ